VAVYSYTSFYSEGALCMTEKERKKRTHACVPWSESNDPGKERGREVVAWMCGGSEVTGRGREEPVNAQL
jgi:hypothetical protein